MSVIEYWNQRNAKRGKVKSSEYNKKRHKYLRSLINKKQGTALKVDLWNEGGNKGCFDITLFELFTIIGMDLSQIACNKAKIENPWMNIINATINFLPFREETVHSILDISTSDHIPFKKFQNCIRDYTKILKEKGELLMIFNNRLPKTTKKTGPHSYWFTQKEVKETISKYFNIEILKPYGTHPNELKHFLLKAVKK